MTLRPFTVITLLSASALTLWFSPPEGLSSVDPNVIRWVTQGEEDNFGYDVYRGADKKGPFERINQRTLAGAGTTDLPQRYSYTDSAIEADTVYWYYVESVSLSGIRRPITPVYPSRPKPRRLF